ncbi:MAG: hypothetical protein ACOC0B_01550, partial [bacterium]
MGTKKAGLRLVPVAVVLLLFSTACNWQMFESVEVRAEPEVRVPAGTVTETLNEFLDDIQESVDAEHQPYSSAGEFEDRTGLNADDYNPATLFVLPFDYDLTDNLPDTDTLDGEAYYPLSYDSTEGFSWTLADG